MAALATCDEIRQGFAAAVDAALVALSSTWRESVFTPQQLLSDGAGGAGRYSVEVPSSAPVDAQRQPRASAGEPLQMRTQVVVRWAYRLRADAAVADYDAALGVERTVVGALQGMGLTGMGGWKTLELTREVVGDGTWLLGTIRVQLVHAYVGA